MSAPATTSAATACARRQTAPGRSIPAAAAWPNASAAVFELVTRSASAGVAALPARQRRQRRQVDRAPLGMQIKPALRQLAELGRAAGHRHPRYRMAAQVFQHPADEVAHVDQRLLGQTQMGARRRLGGAAGGPGDVDEAGRARDVDAAMDRVDPGGAGIRHHDAGGAQDRQAAEHPKPRVHRLERDRRSVRHRDRHRDVPPAQPRPARQRSSRADPG